ncbi:MAG: gliding motility-associated C-terminal domain-containing protein [Cyclobacteriaceae bacterium]
MAVRLFSILFLLSAMSANAQFVVSPSTPMAIGKSASTDIVIESIGDIILSATASFKNANVDFHLLGSGKLINAGTKPDTIGSISLNGTGDYSVLGKWVVLDDIDFQQGDIVTPTATVLNDRITYLGPNLGQKPSGGGSAQSHVVGPFFIKSTGTVTFPLGSGSDFYPAQLINLNDASAIYGMNYVAADPGIPTDSLSSDIDQVFTSWHWRLGIFNRSSFAGAPISLSLNGVESFIGSEKAVIIEKDSLGYINNLLGSLNNPYVTSTSNVFTKGGIYAIASSKDVSIKIHKLITPNGDGHNENLVIEGIDYYNKNVNPSTSNKVTLLDRWGAMYFQKDNFSNYSTDVAQQSDFDYSKLSNGNYICIVEFTDASGKTHKPNLQMITVIK